MEREKQEAVIEAVLFTMGESVSLNKLAELIEDTPSATRKIIGQMQEKMEKEDRGVSIVELDNSFQMCTKADMYEYLIRIAKTPRKYALSDTLLETLSIIAYKQPVTKLDIEKIRGVNCDHAVNRLLEFDLIKELGRLDAPGRPLLFGTTEQFLRSFGVKSLEELPELNPVQLEEFKEQAEQEVQMQLDI
ncbi:MAG: SMC-Scp complex subunit ScpB [Lachnospiraceae bacterium]|nr:SMC-Scp complex subunit ScpB [Lachnospiraceae bacterium]